jgi:enoyl-CoA hydratase/carnithine racemase
MEAALCSALADQLAYAAEDRGVRAVIITRAERFPWAAT